MSIVIILWMVVSSLGLVFSAIDSISAFNHHVLASAAQPKNERLLKFTKSTVLSQVLRSTILLLFFLLGVNELLNGPTGMFVWLMFLANFAIVGESIRSHIYRKEIFSSEGEAAGEGKANVPEVKE